MTFLVRWIRGVITHRAARLVAAMGGVAVTIALLATLGTFLANSSATMTSRAIAEVPVDWQIQLLTPAAESAVRAALAKTTPTPAVEPVWYADVGGFTASTGGTVQTTGAGKVVGLPNSYLSTYPRIVRKLTGNLSGVLLAQQTAANLHASEGDTVTVMRTGQPPVNLTVTGVVNMPSADTFFQAVGVPAGTAPQAPPDNVMILPLPRWHELFDPQLANRPDTVIEQLHVRIAHKLAASPIAAYTQVVGLAHNFEARVSGTVIVADNLAARISAVRSDAAYARVLFLFLGLPGALLAALLTIAIADSGRNRRRRELALLRTRGAGSGRILRIESIEAGIVAAGGVVLGWLFTLLVGKLMNPSTSSFFVLSFVWLAIASAVGVILAMGAVLYPVWRSVRLESVASSRRRMRRSRTPLWRKLYLDVWLLLAAAVVYWQTAASGYQVVLAPEGVPQISVHYSTFFAPLFLWLGGVLLAVRLWELYLERGKASIARMLKFRAGALSGAAAAMMSRQRVLLARGVVL
ncbi:MAG TPA: FtsX-like permease family protein, partial [Spirochaetia bacterium]|nr:FtsX-like permease family protein [Spirochaetia bacterium]